MKCYYNERRMLQPSCCHTQQWLLCSAQSIMRGLPVKLQDSSQGWPAASWRLWWFSYSVFFFPSAVDKHLKNFGMNIILEDKIFLENEKRETGCFFVLPLQMYRLWVCVPQELYEWRRPAGVCLQQGVFFLCCYLLSASLSSPLMLFHRDTGFMCSMSMQTEFFLSVRSIWSYGEHAINSKTNVDQIPGGLECHVCSIPSKHLRTRSIVIQVFLKQRKQ